MKLKKSRSRKLFNELYRHSGYPLLDHCECFRTLSGKQLVRSYAYSFDGEEIAKLVKLGYCIYGSGGASSYNSGTTQIDIMKEKLTNEDWH